MSKIYLVSCVAGKRSEAVPAAVLYISDWFTKARKFVEATGETWFILSAEHGLLAPDDIIGPYDRTLNKMRIAERRAWADQVLRQMEAKLPDAQEVIVLAGVRYRENLMPWLCARYAKVTVPMEGLRIGSQISWLKKQITY